MIYYCDFVLMRRKRRVLFALASTILMILPSSVFATLSIDTAVSIAIENNPSLAQIKARYRALSEIPSQVGTLADPVISVGAVNFPTDTFSRDQEQMTQLQIGVVQSFPFPGKLGLKEQAAEYAALAASHSVAELQLQLISSVRRSWWDVFYLDHALDTVRLNQKLFRELIKVAETKYETGSGLQQDVLLAQLELSKLLDQEIKVVALRRNHAIRLNVLMNANPGAVVVLPPHKSGTLSALRAESEYISLADSARPLLKQKGAEVDEANSRLDLANRDLLPDFSLGLTYGDRTGNNPLPRGDSRANMFSVKLGIKLPLYSKRKQSKAIKQRSSELQGRHYAAIDAKASVSGVIATAVTTYDRASKEFTLYELSIVPQATQTVNSMLAGYQVDEVDFLNLVQSQITLLNYQLLYWKAWTEAKQSLAQLEAAVGEENIYE